MKTTGSCKIFEGLDSEEIMWMSHGDKLHEVPEGFTKCGSTDNAEFVAIQNLEKKMWGLQVREALDNRGLSGTIPSIL